MGSLILCHKKKAEQPYKITRIHKKIYTIEELCYYLCNNLYLIDHTIMNETLCEWIYTELDMKDLARELLELIHKKETIEKFTLCILNYARIYSSSEILHIKNVLERLKNQKAVERQKYKADNLLESGEYESAILVYLSILQEERDESVDERFYGRVYGCLGAAYGRELLYEESAKMYEKAYEICREESMLMARLYACSRYMPEDEYQEMLLENEAYFPFAEQIEEKMKTEKITDDQEVSKPVLEKWKEDYRVNL